MTQLSPAASISLLEPSGMSPSVPPTALRWDRSENPAWRGLFLALPFPGGKGRHRCHRARARSGNSCSVPAPGFAESEASCSEQDKDPGAADAGRRPRAPCKTSCWPPRCTAAGTNGAQPPRRGHLAGGTKSLPCALVSVAFITGFGVWGTWMNAMIRRCAAASAAGAGRGGPFPPSTSRISWMSRSAPQIPFSYRKRFPALLFSAANHHSPSLWIRPKPITSAPKKRKAPACVSFTFMGALTGFSHIKPSPSKGKGERQKRKARHVRRAA